MSNSLGMWGFFCWVFFFPSTAISIPKLFLPSGLLNYILRELELTRVTWWSFNSRWQWTANLTQLPSCTSSIAAALLISDKHSEITALETFYESYSAFC